MSHPSTPNEAQDTDDDYGRPVSNFGTYEADDHADDLFISQRDDEEDFGEQYPSAIREFEEEEESEPVHDIPGPNEALSRPHSAQEFGNSEGDEMEEWGFYDENEGQDLEAALDESMEKFVKDMADFEINKPTGDYEMSNDTALPQGKITFDNDNRSLKFTTSPKRIVLVDERDETDAIEDGDEGLALTDRQIGLLDLHDEQLESESTESDHTWPRTPLAEADSIIRDYLPGLFDSDEIQPQLTGRSDSDTPLVLESENPMMAKFQQVLREHLLRQISRIKEQINHIDGDTKRILDESKLRADSVYREEKFVRKQRADIEAYRANIEQIQSRREAFEKELDNVREAHKKMKHDFNNLKRMDENLIKEREMMNDLLHKMKAYESEKDQTLRTSQAVSKNQQHEKRKLAEDKMKQDMLIWRLEKEIIRLNNEIERSASNCKDMRDETECLDKLLKRIEDDSLGLEAENKLLQSSIIKMYGVLKDCDSRKLTAQQTLETRINNYNMIAKNKLFWKNELKKEYSELESLESQRTEFLAHLDLLRNKLIRLERMIQELERDVERKHLALTMAEDEKNKFEKEESGLLKFKRGLDHEVDNKVMEMDGLKRALNELLVEKQITEKGIGYLQTEIRKLGDQNNLTEERIVDSELALAKALLDVEKARSGLLQSKTDLDRLQKTQRDVGQELREANALLLRLKTKCNLLTTKQQTLEKRLSAKNKADPKNAIGVNEMPASWAETKLKRMQEALKMVTELTKKLSDGWFNLQNVILKRKDDRARQIHQLNIKRKHCHTMDSCRIRVERNVSQVQHNMSKTKKELCKEQRNFERWQTEKARACDKLERLTGTNTELEVRFVDEIAEAEKEARHIESEIDRLRAEIQEMSKETARLQAEYLEAEKQRDLAEIAKAKIERCQAPSGELGQLKAEIHRMEVRYSHLKKAQEKLMVDLEMCITRRDRMIDNAEAREVRSQATGKQWSRMQVQRKMDDLKNKTQSLKRKNSMMNKDQLELSYQLAGAREEFNNIKSGIETLKANLEELERQMEEGQLHKHGCLEATVYRQKKAKLLEDFKFGRYRSSYKTPGTLAAEEEKQNHMMNTLRTVLENLLNDFPQLHLQIAQIANTLQPVLPETDALNGDVPTQEIFQRISFSY